MPAKLPVGRGADGPAARDAGGVLLEREQLLGAEGLVVDLRRGLDEVLQVGAGEEVAQRDELAVVLVLDVDDAPAVLAAAHLLAADDDVLLGPDDGEGDQGLHGAVHLPLLVVVLVVVVGEHAQVVELELLPYALLERLALLQRQRVGLCDHGHHVDHVGELLQDDDVDGFETVWGLAGMAAGRWRGSRLTHGRTAG